MQANVTGFSLAQIVEARGSEFISRSEPELHADGRTERKPATLVEKQFDLLLAWPSFQRHDSHQLYPRRAFGRGR